MVSVLKLVGSGENNLRGRVKLSDDLCGVYSPRPPQKTQKNLTDGSPAWFSSLLSLRVIHPGIRKKINFTKKMKLMGFAVSSGFASADRN
ncbi:hypothetical protein BaRGS_00008859 [Batillaria attramentaria]|uniref:Uncharacterized protein n=1 Tax=Batillaria attramentaria TaxID=370345 RepID=A0ABD0LL85_9CAEN